MQLCRNDRKDFLHEAEDGRPVTFPRHDNSWEAASSFPNCQGRILIWPRATPSALDPPW